VLEFVIVFIALVRKDYLLDNMAVEEGAVGWKFVASSELARVNSVYFRPNIT
jgi:hypothetical protein